MFWQIFLETLGMIVFIMFVGFVIYRLVHTDKID